MKIFPTVTKTNIFFTLAVLFYILASYVFVLLPDGLISSSFSMVLPQILILISCVAYIKIGKPEEFGKGRYRLLNLWQLIPVIAIVLAFIPVSQLLNIISMQFVKNSTEGIVATTKAYPVWMSLIMVAVI